MAGEFRQRWLWISEEDLETELLQLQDEGRDIGKVEGRFRWLTALGDRRLTLDKHQAQAGELLDDAQRLKTLKGYPFREPSDLAGIRKLRPGGPRRYAKLPSDRVLRDRIHAAWLGRCIGCLLGKPIEGAKFLQEHLHDFLKLSGQFPLRDYVRLGVRGKAREKYPEIAQHAHFFDKIDHMPVDDDTNYTTIGMLVVEQFGPDFTPADVGSFWLFNMPIAWACTAERVAYRNLADGIAPPRSASHRNVYREWIGAQIRADAFGYVNVGNPERAAEFAWRDASISHVKNGIYGEMFVAAMTAAAPFCDSIEQLIQIGLSEIPTTSRLYTDVSDVFGWRRWGLPYDQAAAMVRDRWDESKVHYAVHTNSNAAICAVALLWGEGDFERTICGAAQAGFDTDCNAATVGSIVGMMRGTRAIPEKWSRRLNNTLKTSLTGYDTVRISDMSRETFRLYRKIR